MAKALSVVPSASKEALSVSDIYPIVPLTYNYPLGLRPAMSCDMQVVLEH